MGNTMKEKRIWNPKALQEEGQQNIRDTISHIYLKILKANLTNDTCQNIMVAADEAESVNEHVGKLSDCLVKFAEAGYVNQEDLKEYMSFCNLEHLRKQFRDGSSSVCFHYRRKINGQFRWVSMELVPGKEYREDNQVVYLYVKDVHDHYLRQLDLTVRKGIKSALNIVNLNPAGSRYESGSGAYANQIEEKDTSSDNAGALLSPQDVTEKYLQSLFTPMLYQSNFQTVGIIDLRHRTIALPVRETNDASPFTYSEVPYDEARQKVCMEKVTPGDREEYLIRTAPENLSKKLAEDDGYGFLTYYEEDGKERVKSYQFHYLSEEFELVIVTDEDVTSLSEKDALTGGVNQHGFIKKVGALLEEQGQARNYAILCMDVKNFKAINELFGIFEGNNLLKRLYRDLEKSFLEPFITARGEADQYLCLLDWDKLDYDKLISWCETDYLIKGRPFRVSKRCGIYRIQDHTLAVRRMCDRAKLAMSIAKGKRSTKPYAIFDDTMSAEYIDHSEILGRFDNSLKNEEFCVYLQPVVDPATGQISSAEALVRWNYPEKGFISPQHFIPVLEGSGDISQLDLYVARKVEKFQNEREQQGLPIVPVSVNLSWTDFYDKELLEWLHGYVESRKHKNHTIHFEITETSYAAVAENRNVLFHQIRQHGTELLLDDFGSGYSSFSTLLNYDFDILKIDMGFVKRIEECDKTKGIIDSIIKMAHQMDAKTVAEGAETQEQVDFLREKGCDYIQGYYFYKPMTMERFAEVLDSRKD